MPSQISWKTNPAYAEYDENRENIILAAAKVIESSSIEKLRLGEVAKEAGCVRQTLYRYFNSKQELIDAVLLHFTLLNAIDVMQRVEGIDDPKERLVEILFHSANNLIIDPKFKIFIEAPDSMLFSGISDGSVFELVNQFGTAELSDFSMGKAEHEIKDFYTWIAIQVVALANFGLAGKSEQQARDFIRHYIVEGPL